MDFADLGALIGGALVALGLDRYFRRRAHPTEIRRAANRAIDAVIVGLESGDLKLPTTTSREIEDWLLDQWEDRFNEELIDEGLRVGIDERRRARRTASARLVERAIDAAHSHNREVVRAAAVMSAPETLRRRRLSDAPEIKK